MPLPPAKPARQMAHYWWTASIDYFFRGREFTLGAAFAASALALWLAAEYPVLRGNLDAGLAMMLALALPFVVCAVLLIAAARVWKRKRGEAFCVIDLGILGRITRDFRCAEHARAAAMIEAYVGPQRPQVVAALLALSRGDIARLSHMCDVAKTDFRDVLAWAEQDSR